MKKLTRHPPPRLRLQPPSKEFEAVSLDDVTTEVQEWIREPFTPEGVFGLLVGREGIGKGLYTAEENALLTKGLGDSRTPMNVGVFAIEDSLTVQTRPRHVAADAVMSRVFTLRNCKDTSQSLMIDLPGDIEILRQFITAKKLGLLTIDPLISSFDSRVKVEKEKPVRDVLERLRDLAEETHCTIRGTIHFNKATGMDILDRIMNSKAFSAVSRHTLVMGYDPSDQTGARVMVVVAKSNVWMIGDAIVFEKRSAGVGKKRRDGTEGTVGYLVEAARRTGVDPRTVLERPEAAKVDPDEAVIRDLIKGHPPMNSADYNQVLSEHLIGYAKAKRIEQELGIVRRQADGQWWAVDVERTWKRENTSWVVVEEPDEDDEDSEEPTGNSSAQSQIRVFTPRTSTESANSDESDSDDVESDSADSTDSVPLRGQKTRIWAPDDLSGEVATPNGARPRKLVRHARRSEP